MLLKTRSTAARVIIVKYQVREKKKLIKSELPKVQEHHQITKNWASMAMLVTSFRRYPCSYSPTHRLLAS